MSICAQPTGLAGAAARGVAFQATMATGVAACAAIGWASLRVACRLGPSELELADCGELTGFGSSLLAASLGAVTLNAVPALFVAATAPQNEPFGLEVATAYLISSSFEAPCAALAGALLLGADANGLFHAAGIGCLVLLGSASGVGLVVAGLLGAYERRARSITGRCPRHVFATEAGSCADAAARTPRPLLPRTAERAVVAAFPLPYASPPPYTSLPTERTYLFGDVRSNKTYAALEHDLERGEVGGA